MEDRAIEMIKLMLSRREPGRKLDTQEVELADLPDNVATKLLSVGDALVVFMQRAKVSETDIRNLMTALANNQKAGRSVICVSLGKPSEAVEKVIKALAKEGVQFFRIQELQFDLAAHRMVPSHRILKEDERTRVFEEYKVSDPENQLPWIDSQDPPVKWAGAKPGDVVEIVRHSDAAGASLVYRYVVEDVNVAQ